MMVKRILVLGCTVLVAATCCPREADSQVSSALTLERLGMLTTPGTGARPFAMGGAFTAVSDDAFALLYNPAGLAQIRRKEVSIGLHHANDDITNDFTGLAVEKSHTYTAFGHFSAVYPYPTYRGSLVVGFGIFRVGTSELETMRGGIIEDPDVANGYAENLLLQSGNIYQYHLGVGLDISPRLALGAGLVIWDESTDFTEEIYYEDNDSTALYTDDVSMDLDGFGFNIGLLFRLHERIRAGFMLSSPTWISYRGEGFTTYSSAHEGGGGWEPDSELGIIDTDYTLPWQMRGGLSVSIASLLIAADVTYIDYSQTKWEGLSIIDENDIGGRKVLNSTWNFNIGAEFTLPMYPVRLRGGYSYTPLALESNSEISYIKGDIDYYESIYDLPLILYADSDVKKNRQCFSFGVGALIDRVLTLDVACAIGGFERSAGELTEETSSIQVIASGGYRF
jgi:long-chain fatty acid transport protein